MKNFSLKHVVILLSLFVLTGFSASAQSISVSGDLSVSPGGTVFTADAASFKLTASADDGNGVTYTKYAWAEINPSGGGDPITGQESAVLQLTNVSPGYHTYRVFGIKDNADGAVCSGETADFTVYVLPKLQVTATIPNSTILKYCANDVPPAGGSKEILITAQVTGFDGTPNKVGGLPEHTHSDFVYEYKWFRVATDGTKTPVGTDQPTYAVVGTDAGNYKYEVQVAYKVKNTTSYSVVAQSNGGDAQIIVAPKPGKPTITIM